MIDEETQKELLSLKWNDFSTYPPRYETVYIHAEGFDTKERVHRHFFFEVEYFSPRWFPTETMIQTLSKYHCKWTYWWLPPLKQQD